MKGASATYFEATAPLFRINGVAGGGTLAATRRRIDGCMV